MRNLTLTVFTSVFILLGILIGRAEAQCDDATLRAQLTFERDQVIAEVPAPVGPLEPVERVPRKIYGKVGNPPLDFDDLEALIFPSASESERDAVLRGLVFFTIDNSLFPDGSGGIRNQPNCLGCHTSSREAVDGLVTTISQASRAARSTPTNFVETGQGIAADTDDPINGTGKTASFTIYGNSCANPTMTCGSPAGPGCVNEAGACIAAGRFDALARAPFFGTVQHTRPNPDAVGCPADPLPSRSTDPNLAGVDPEDGWMNTTPWASPTTGFRRSTVERAGPPYIGRGLMEAVPNADLIALEDEGDTLGTQLTAAEKAAAGCTGDCISGRHNEASTTAPGQNIHPADIGFPTARLSRFGLRGQGPQLVTFISVGSQEEVGVTNAARPTENDPANHPAECTDNVPDPDTCLDRVLSTRSLIRMTAPPEFGHTLLSLLKKSDPSKPRNRKSPAGKVQRGAELFGVDLVAFANRMIPGRFPEGGDGRLDDHAISASRTSLMCASCHTPVQRTGRSPASLDNPDGAPNPNVGAEHLSNKWAPIFADLLLHGMPVIDAERAAPTARLPLEIPGFGFDLHRNFTEDALPNQGRARSEEWRTAPLMGIGKMGPPFLHDARVYLSVNTLARQPATTVRASRGTDNERFVVDSLDLAILAAIELHDLPAPRVGCPIPPVDQDGLVRVGPVVYGSPAAAEAALCPPLNSPNRSEARAVMERWHNLSLDDQQAVIEFLKQL